jgi:hypothetical protein
MQFTASTLSTLSLLLALPALITAYPCQANEIGIGNSWMCSGSLPYNPAGNCKWEPLIYATDCGILDKNSNAGSYCNISWDNNSIVGCNDDRTIHGISTHGNYYNRCYKPQTTGTCASWAWGSFTVDYCCKRMGTY